MVIARAESIPAFPECICTHIYPVLIAREGGILYDIQRGAYLSAYAERIENGFISEYAEIEMTVLLGYLLLQSFHKRSIFVLFT